MVDRPPLRRHLAPMSESAPRVIAAVVATVAILCVIAVIRSREPVPDTAPQPEPRQIARSTRPQGLERPAAERRNLDAAGAASSTDLAGAPRPGAAPPEEAAGREPVPAGREPLGAVPSLGEGRAVSGRQLAAEAIPPQTPGAIEPDGGTAALAEAASPSGAQPSFAALRGDSDAAAGAAQVTAENVDFEVEPGAYFPPNAALSFSGRGGLRVEEGTVMFWVQPVDWDGSVQDSYSFFLLRDPKTLDHHFAILKNQHSLRFQVVNEAGVQVNLFSPIDDWQRGEWHHVAATWGNSLLNLYVDGERVAADVLDGLPAVPPDSPAYWGSSRGTNGAGAILADTRIFDRVLGEEDILAEAARVPR